MIPSLDTALAGMILEWQAAHADFHSADDTAEGVSVEQASRLYRAEARLLAFRALATPLAQEELADRIRQHVSAIQREMRAHLGPSWPPNDIAGTLVQEWHDRLQVVRNG